MAWPFIFLIVGIVIGLLISTVTPSQVQLSPEAVNLIGLFAVFLILMGVWCAPRALDARHRRADDWKDKHK